MAKENTKSKTVEPLEAIKLFNEFQAQSRARAEATIKLVLFISGGMLTLSVGAVLGDKPPNIPVSLLPVFTWGLGLLFYSMAASLVLMLSMIIATFHMGVRWRKNLQVPKEDFVFLATWPWLRILNASLGASALVSCVIGIAFMAQVALGVASTLGTRPTDHPNALAPAAKPSNSKGATSEKVYLKKGV